MDVDVSITVYMNLTITKYKSTNTTSSETTGSFFYFISKLRNLRFASTGPGSNNLLLISNERFCIIGQTTSQW